MKNSFTLILILVFTLSYSQAKKEHKTNPKDSVFIGNCESGTQRAIKDAKNKNYKSYSYGLVIMTKSEWEFTEYYQKYMKAKYGILIKNGGCVILGDSGCYSKTMEALIQKEFGVDIFERTKKEARILFNKSK